MIPRALRLFAYGAICAGTLLATPAGEGTPPQTRAAYYRGQVVDLEITPAATQKHLARVGPWAVGARLRDSHPRDRRLNLYFVFPGDQYRSAARPEYDHNCIVNALPDGDQPVEWDVYYAVVLDPSLEDDIRDERELILATQTNFRPPDLLEFDDLPASGFLRAAMKIDSLPGLARFRHKDGTLPRVEIVPAGFAIRATAQTSIAAGTQ